MRRRYRTVIALALLVLLAGCAGQTAPLATSNATDTDRRTITVSATGQAAQEPDIATVEVTVEAFAADAETARGDLAEDATAVRQALLDAGVDEDDVQTTRYAIRPEYDRNERDTITGYRAVHAYEITVRNPDDAGSVIDTAVGAGADRVNSVRFGLSEDAEQAVRQQAIENAMTNAEGDASAVAGASDVDLGPVHTATVSSPSPFRHTVEYTMAADAGSSTQIDSGPVQVQVQVTVTYQIE